MKKVIRRKRRVVKRKAPTKSVSLAVKKYVKRTIHSQIENKVVNIERVSSFGSVLTDSNLNMFPMCPYTSLFPVPIGTTNGTRVGNQIKTRRVILSYVLRPTPYSSSAANNNPQPFHAQMFLGRYKQASGILPTGLELTTLFDNGSSSFGPISDLGDLCADINKDAWDIKKKWSHKVGTAIFSGPGNLQNFGFFANNDFALNVVKKMDITRYCPKTIKFNDAAGSTQGPNLFLFYQAIPTTGGIFQANERPANLDYWISYTYEDA